MPSAPSTPAPVRLVDLAEQHRRIQEEVEEAVVRVLRSGAYVLGREVAAFEEELAAFCGVRHAVACASGTDALTLALLSIGIRPGDEVIVPAFTIQVDAEVVSLLGGVPRFAEIDPATFDIDPARIAEQVTPRTRAVIAVHLYGMPADMDGIRAVAEKHGLAVVEDACQGIGSRYHGRRAGGLGDVGCFSFFPTKNLGAAGDGGALTTDDPERAAMLRRLRNHGTRAKYVHEAIGLNSRLDEVQAAVLRVKLRHLPDWTARRGELTARYDAGLLAAGLRPPKGAPGRETNHHQYTLRSARRDALRAALAAEGIEAAVHYPLAPFRQPVYAGRYEERAWPVAARAAAEVISLPLSAELTPADVDRVVAAVTRFERSGPAPDRSGKRLVAGVILHREGRVLLQHRDDDPAIRFPGFWSLFSGHVEDGETPEQGARREIEEELGLRLEGPLRLAYHGEDDTRERFIYEAALPVAPEALSLREGQGMALVARDELSSYRIVPLHREILDGFYAGWSG